MKTLVLCYCFALIWALSSSTPLRESKVDLLEARFTENVKFYLYTKNNAKIPQELVYNNVDTVKNSNFNKAHPTRILIHGWLGSYKSTPNGPLRDAYLSKSDYNIISVDWNKYAQLNYILARSKVPVVGEDLALFVDVLNKKLQMSFDSLVVIGHSLGAHVAGYCGKLVKRAKLPAIVGLDPAYPFYSYDNPLTRLASTDAKYVETIQTNANAKGFLQPIGTAAFYPNWGDVQPGCGNDIDGTCSHARSVTLYAEAIEGYSFAPIYKCNSFANILDKNGCKELTSSVKVGDPSQIKHKSGIYYFATKSQVPFGHL